MKTLTLKVTIEGGSSQLGIYYKLVKKEHASKPVQKKHSFEEVFNDLNGDYTLYIGGSNADSDKRRAIISLVFDDKEITLDKDLSYANPSIQKGKHIYAEYYFKA
ncbi:MULTISPECIES: hypothetical protein [Chryseobacterium]|uniref:Uncharacterized protein n=1 Tax=Chryseobacterium cucumeris TaxID=1813611 RepID=A0ABX9X5U0_9FLAO|nr:MULTISPECIES: hypothetical protein [Chryseobacterium]KYH06504.1 hypothetical protein A1704_09475 [Chryseobacterium cucumeris]MDH5035208.1 hypothetical protein [Chryseobacterium cucumeris]QWT84337.1 hypothetical protein KBP46_12460 [Chryseobacterium sp. PCH239]ROH92289.1 hypothetical protein EGI15_08550 [Chryseobacterium cucumeris]WFB66526.1 hypothetical protein PZ898_17530 [Chryseobacterium sp. WX]